MVIRHLDVLAKRYKVESRACQKRSNDLEKVNDLTNEELREVNKEYPAGDSMPVASLTLPWTRFHRQTDTSVRDPN